MCVPSQHAIQRPQSPTPHICTHAHTCVHIHHAYDNTLAQCTTPREYRKDPHLSGMPWPEGALMVPLSTWCKCLLTRLPRLRSDLVPPREIKRRRCIRGCCRKPISPPLTNVSWKVVTGGVFFQTAGKSQQGLPTWALGLMRGSKDYRSRFGLQLWSFMKGHKCLC